MPTEDSLDVVEARPSATIPVDAIAAIKTLPHITVDRLLGLWVSLDQVVGLLEGWVAPANPPSALDAARRPAPALLEALTEAGSESVSSNGGDVQQPDGPVVDEPAATDSDPLERARALIETIQAASGELATLYGSLWHRRAALSDSPTSVETVDPDGAGPGHDHEMIRHTHNGHTHDHRLGPAGPATVEALAAEIRAIDGSHDTGAGALAEALIRRGWSRQSDRPSPPDPPRNQTAYMGEHKPLPDGRCEHRWRNRQTVIVDCAWANGYAAGLAARPSPVPEDER